MNRRTRWLIAIPCVVLVLLLLAATALVLFINPDQFRPRIQAAVQARTGLQLQLAGPLHWTFWPAPGIELGAGSLDTAPGAAAGEAPLLQWKSFAVGAKWWPLLHWQLALDRVRFEGLTVTLRVDARGRGNWTGPVESATAGGSRAGSGTDPGAGTDPGSASGKVVTGGDATSTGMLHVSAITLRDARIDYRDARDGATWQVQKLALDLGLAADTGTGRYTLAAPALSAEVSGGTFPRKPLPIAFTAPTLEFNTTLLQLKMPSWSARVAETVLRGAMTQPLALKPLAGAGHVALQGASLRGFIEGFGMTVRPMRDVHTLGAWQLAADWRLTPTLAQATAVDIVVDDMHLRGSAQLGLAATGDAVNASTSAVPIVAIPYIELSGDRIQLDRYLPPLNYKSPPFELPVAALKAIHVRGHLNFQSAQLQGVVLHGVRVELQDGQSAPVDTP